MSHFILEIMHIGPLVLMALYTAFVSARFFASKKLLVLKSTKIVASVLSTIGIIGHVMQPAHHHMTEPCVVYVAILAYVAVKEVRRLTARN